MLRYKGQKELKQRANRFKLWFNLNLVEFTKVNSDQALGRTSFYEDCEAPEQDVQPSCG